jgi:sulfatase maturation enzyme AslB (radical SAM superfamily)
LLVCSPFLVRVPIDCEEAVFFHSLFGTSLILNREAQALLGLFRSPTATSAVLTLRQRHRLSGALDKLAERRFLVSPGADERKDFVRLARPHPPDSGAHLTGLVLLAAEQCNLACPYCIKDKLMDLRPERPQTRMTIATARIAIDHFFALAERNGHRDLQLQFRGGEAFVNAPVVLEAARYARSAWSRGRLGISVVTNATLVTEAIAREMAELEMSAEVSVDGTRDVHDSVRYTKSRQPTYDAVLAGLRRLLAAGVAVTNVNATMTEETFPRIGSRFLSLLASLGVRLVNLEPDVLRPVHPDPRVVARRLLALRRKGRAMGIEVGGCWARPLQAIGEVRRGDGMPRGDYVLLVVDALGQVVRWEYNPERELGPVAKLPEMLASPAFARHVASRTPGQIPECRGCEIEGVCQGNASFSLLYEKATGRPGLFAHRCGILKAVTRGMLVEREEGLKQNDGAQRPLLEDGVCSSREAGLRAACTG